MPWSLSQGGWGRAKKELAYGEEQVSPSGPTWTRWSVFSSGPYSVLGVEVGFVSVPGQPPAQTTLLNSLPPPLFSLPGKGDSGPHVEPAERDGGRVGSWDHRSSRVCWCRHPAGTASATSEKDLRSEWLSDFLGPLSAQVGAWATHGRARPPAELSLLSSQLCKVTNSFDGGTAQGPCYEPTLQMRELRLDRNDAISRGCPAPGARPCDCQVWTSVFGPLPHLQCS